VNRVRRWGRTTQPTNRSETTVTQPTPFPFPGAPQAAPSGDLFGAAAPQGDYPRMRDLYGRLVMIAPISIERNRPSTIEPGKTEDRLTADVIVLPGGREDGPLAYGGAPEKMPPTPHTKSQDIGDGWLIESMWVNQKAIVSGCRDALRNRASGNGQSIMVLGVLGFGKNAKPGQAAPYILEPFTSAQADIARRYLAAHPYGLT